MLNTRTNDKNPTQEFGDIQDSGHFRNDGQMKETEENLRTCLENAPDGVYLSDLKGTFLYGNKKAEEISGYKRDELIGENFFSVGILPAKYLVKARKLLALNAAAKPAGPDEFELIKKDGTPIWVEINTTPIQQSGRPIVIGFVRDITERKQAEILVRESEEKYFSLVESSNDGIAIFQDGLITFANKKMLEIGGYAAEDCLGKPFIDFVAPNFRPVAIENYHKRIAGQAVPFRYESAILNKNGLITPVEINVSIIQYQGKYATTAIIRDISERKCAEETLRISELNFRNSLDLSPLGIAIYDNKYNLAYVNRTLLDIYGFNSLEEYRMTSLEQRYTPKSYADFMKRSEKVSQGDESATNFEIDIIRKNGTVRTLQAFRKCVMWQGTRHFQYLYEDITDRAQKENALRESEERYRSLFKNMLNGLAYCQMLFEGDIPQDFIYLEVNENFEKLTGLKNAVGKKVTELIPGIRESDPEIFEIYGKVARTGIPTSCEIYLEALQMWFTVSVYSPRLGYFVAVFDVINERKRAESLTKIRLDLLDYATTHSLKEILQKTLDEVGTITQSPIGFYNFVEADEKTLCLQAWSTRTLEEFCKTDGQGMHCSIDQAGVWADCFHQRKPVVHNDYLSLPDKKGYPKGHVSVIRELVVPIIREDKVVALLGVGNKPTDYTEQDIKTVSFLADVAWEIAERKQVEIKIERAAEEWRRTFDSISDFVSIHDKDCRIVRVNKAFAEIHGVKPQALIGKRCFKIMHNTDHPIQSCPHQKTLRSKRTETEEFFESHLGLFLEVTASPLFDEKGQVVGSVHVARDITKRKQIEQQMLLNSKLASVGELASGVAHELNNPLTSVIGFSQLLMGREMPENIKEDLSLICSEAQRAAVIVKNLLTFARQHPPVKQSVRIENIIEDVFRLRAYEQKVHNIEVVKLFEPNIPEITIDYSQIQQVFLNIIINAEYFMIKEHNRGTLTIRIEKLESMVRISFTDDGPGISGANLGRLFDPFFTTKEVGKGTGLGLSICHGIVAEHRGRIYATSHFGKGATFVVELPTESSN